MTQLQAGDRICLSCGGKNGKHHPDCLCGDAVQVISVYTRKQALEDGILVDCEQEPMGTMRRQLLKWPLAMTIAAFDRYVWPTDGNTTLPPGQSIEGRFWDVIWMLYCAAKGTVSCRRLGPRTVLFDFYCIVADSTVWQNERIDDVAREGAAGLRRVTLKTVCGPGDEGEPVMTLMLPEED